MSQVVAANDQAQISALPHHRCQHVIIQSQHDDGLLLPLDCQHAPSRMFPGGVLLDSVWPPRIWGSGQIGNLRTIEWHVRQRALARAVIYVNVEWVACTT